MKVQARLWMSSFQRALTVRWNMWTLVAIPVGKICLLVKGEPRDSDFLESNPLNMCNTAALAVCISQKALLSKLFLWNASLLLSELDITKWRRPWE